MEWVKTSRACECTRQCCQYSGTSSVARVRRGTRRPSSSSCCTNGKGFMVQPRPPSVAWTKARDDGSHQIGGCHGAPPMILRANLACKASLRLNTSTGATARVRRSEEHTSELQSLMRISYAVFCLKKKRILHNNSTDT